MRYRSLGRNSLRRLQTDHIDLRRQRHELRPGRTAVIASAVTSSQG